MALTNKDKLASTFGVGSIFIIVEIGSEFFGAEDLGPEKIDLNILAA
jgi:hypothetical protein